MRYLQLVIKEKKKIRINKIFELLLYLVGYILSFIIVTNLFDSVYIDLNHYFIYSILIVTILSVLNKTIKPILVTLTIPITGATLGIFYLFINLFMLKLTDWIFGSHFELENIFIAFFVAILLSIVNFLIESIIIKPIIKRGKKNE